MSVLTITCRGLFEAVSDQNMLSNLTRRLDRSRFRVEEFSPWAAGFGDYDVALERTAGLLAERVRRESGPVVLAGYSGGAHVVKRACLALSGDDRRKVARVVLCADPSMPHLSEIYRQDDDYGKLWRGTGVTGSEPLFMPHGVAYIFDEGDPICSTPIGSPLRRLAATLTAMRPGLGNLAAVQAKLARVAAVERQDYSWSAYVEAARLLNAYAVGGAHTRPYPPLLSRVGDDINREVRG